MNRAPPIVAIIPSTEPDERKPDEGGAGVGFIGSDLSTSVNEEILSALKENMLAVGRPQYGDKFEANWLQPIKPLVDWNNLPVIKPC